MDEHIVKITMFKAFTIKYNELLLKEEDMRSERLLSLLSYFVFHHQREITAQELIDNLWFFEDIEKPIGALKNLVYRLRTLIRQELELSDFIITGKGSYYVNDKYQLIIDYIEFEATAKLLEMSQDKEMYEKCLSLYKGAFLPSLEHSHLFMVKNTYYHSLYVSLVDKYCLLLDQQEDYDRMEEITRGALTVEKYDETLYFYLLKAMYKKQEYRKALEAYKQATDFLYQTLGVKPSLELDDLYQTIKKESHSQVTHIVDIQKDIIKETNGAILCDYGIFKDLYNLQARTMKRLLMSSQLCLITINEQDSKEKTMKEFQDCLVSSLRKGDVISQLSTNQIIVLLPNCNGENAQKVLDRVLSPFIHQVQFEISCQDVVAK